MSNIVGGFVAAGHFAAFVVPAIYNGSLPTLGAVGAPTVGSSAVTVPGLLQGQPGSGPTVVADTSVQEGAPRAGTGAPALRTQNGQARVDRAYGRSGLDWGRAPRYDSSLPDFGWTTGDGVLIGPSALQTESLLQSTLVHEDTHVQQLGTGNFAHWRSEVGGIVNEAEAYRAELLQYEDTGVSKVEMDFIAGRYKQQLIGLEQAGTRGDQYLRRILIHEDFTLMSGDRRIGPVPGWIK
jgi:hypothetical protein